MAKNFISIQDANLDVAVTAKVENGKFSVIEQNQNALVGVRINVFNEKWVRLGSMKLPNAPLVEEAVIELICTEAVALERAIATCNRVAEKKAMEEFKRTLGWVS